MSAQKTLYILRHAKAEVGAAGQDDRDRGLTERGVEAARGMGKYFVKHGIKPDKILCSGARRTRDTWSHISEAFPQMQAVEYSDKLYLSSAAETLSLISTLPEAIHSLMLIGHNPGFHQLALKLAKKGEDDTLDLLALKFPTCALATIKLDLPWFAMNHASGELKSFITPKLLGI